jgi:hypothetical protein
MVDVPSVKALSEKQDQVWTREVLQIEMERRAKNDRGTGDIVKNHFDAINRELNQMEEDYRNKFDRLVRLSKNINRLSPAASFVYASTELAGTGIGEESRLKENVLRYKDSVLSIRERGEKQAPAFAYGYRSVGQFLAQGGLFDLAWLVFFNILFFALGYVAFVRYDVR